MLSSLTTFANQRLVPRHRVARQFIKFAMVGVLNTVVDFGVYAAGIFWLDLHYLVANIFAFLAAASNSYLLNRRWTFRSQDPRWHRQATKYFIVLAIGFGLNELFLYLLVEHGQLGKFMGKAIAVAIVLFWNFGANKLWTFSATSATPSIPPGLERE